MTSLNRSANPEGRRSTFRRNVRYAYVKDVSVGILRGDALSYVAGRCHNLSEGGMAVRECGELNIGEIVDVEIELPVGPLRVPASVRHNNRTDYGLEFIALGITERDYIRDACHSLRKPSETSREPSADSSRRGWAAA